MNPVRPLLFEPLTLRGVTVPNRIVVSPMCQYASLHGGPTDWHMAHIGRLAIGGAGTVFLEETAVERRGRKTHHCAGIYDDSHVAAYRRLTDLVRNMGRVPAIQLGHAGAKASCHGAARDWAPLTPDDAANGLAPWTSVAPSAVAARADSAVPHALDHDDIQTVLRAWGDATRRSVDAGFDIVEIHGAHGYLIHQFLSPCTNRRRDAYGGDRKGRMRFCLEVVETVRAALPADKPLFFRLSAVDGRGGLWDIHDTLALAMELKDRGVDVIDCSSGGITGTSTMPIVPRVPGYHTGFSQQVRQHARAATMVSGLITRAEQAEQLLAQGAADLIALARELLVDANWPVNAARELGLDDPLALLPSGYAQRLRMREQIAHLAVNAPGTPIPHDAIALIEKT